MSRSFRGRPEPGEDKQSRHVSGNTPASQEAAPQPREAAQSDETEFTSMNQSGNEENQADGTIRVDIGKRLVAGLIDVMVGYVLQLVVNCIPFVNVFIHDQLPLVGFLIVRDALFNGRGVGKNLMGLQVVDIKTGRPASFIQSIKRNIVVFGPYMALYLVNLCLKIMPNEMVSSLVSNIVYGAGAVYTVAVIPYEVWRVNSRADGLRWGDQFAGTKTVPADMDFSNPLSK